MARSLRFIPKDSGTTVAPGWCFTKPGDPPLECSWCGKETELIETASNHAYLWCALCDEPKPPKEWGGDPSDVDEEVDDAEG